MIPEGTYIDYKSWNSVITCSTCVLHLKECLARPVVKVSLARLKQFLLEWTKQDIESSARQ